MKGNEQMIAKLNAILVDELTAINQYMLHAEMCENWGYAKLHKTIEKRAITEMKHAEKLISRILFLEGMPIVSILNKINIGSQVPDQHTNDRQAEEIAIKNYTEGIRLAMEVGDFGSKELLEANLTEEEAHIDWIEAQLDQINQMGIQNYLQDQTEAGKEG